jgi:broad specificity phosphatase PhoE
MRLIYETHATSTDNEAGVASGHNDPDLSIAGEEQAAELGRRRAAEGVAAVYCSDLRRARRTAVIAFRGRGIPILIDARLRECDFGEMSGRPAAEIDAVRARYVFDSFPGGESYAEVVKRVRRFIEEVRPRHIGQTVIVIAHRGPHHALEHLLRGRDLLEAVTAPWEWRPGWEYDQG